MQVKETRQKGVSLVTASKICTVATAQRLFVDGGLPNYGVHCIALVCRSGVETSRLLQRRLSRELCA